MATYGKPTTSFYINYGNLEPAAAQRALAPALIAPRYRLHRIGLGLEEDTFLTDFPVTESGEVFIWPKKAENSEVDITGVKLIASNIYLEMNSTPLSATLDAESTNCVITTDSVRLVGKTLAEELNGYEAKAGDRIKITQTKEGVESSIITTIVDILPEMSDPAVTLAALSSAPAAGLEVGGTFVGDKTAAYLLTVNKVNDDGSVAFSATAINGDPGYAAHFTAAKDTYSNVGDFGITVTLGTDTLKVGDSYIVSGTPEEVELYNKIFVSDEIEKIEEATVTVTIISSTLSPAQAGISSAYWDIVSGGITVEDVIYLTLSGTTYKVSAAKLYAQYRELMTDDVLELRSSQQSSVSDWVGVADPENPMGMMYAAATQVPGTFFYLLSCDNSEQGTIDAINYVAQYEDAYAPIPYLQTPATQQAVKDVISKYSDPQIAQFKHSWFCSTSGREAVICDKDNDGNALIGSISAAGNLTLTGNADVVGAGVKAGDIVVVIGGYTSTEGSYAETEYVVKRVVNKTTVELKNAEICGISRVYIKRVLSGKDFAAKLAEDAKTINNIRINFVASDELSFLGFDKVEPVYLCVTLAAMRCALPPHAPMNELVVPGFTVNDKMKWTDAEYDIMNAGGVWVVAKNTEGELVTYHQITTRTDGTIAEEDSVVSNGDSIVRQLRQAVKPYASGKCNVTTALLTSLENALTAEFAQIRSIVYNPIYGDRLLSAKINQLYIPEGNKRSVICACNLELPQPMQDGQFIFNLF